MATKLYFIPSKTQHPLVLTVVGTAHFRRPALFPLPCPVLGPLEDCRTALQLYRLPQTFFRELFSHTPPAGKEFILTSEVLGDLRAFIGNTQTSCGNGSWRSMEGNAVIKKSMESVKCCCRLSFPGTSESLILILASFLPTQA